MDRKNDIPRPPSLPEHFKAVFGEELGQRIVDAHNDLMEKRNPYRACADCGEDDPFIFMLRPELWASIAPRVAAGGYEWATGYLCIWCCEKRLGRDLVIKDFTPVAVNEKIFFAMAHMRLVFDRDKEE